MPSYDGFECQPCDPTTPGRNFDHIPEPNADNRSLLVSGSKTAKVGIITMTQVRWQYHVDVMCVISSISNRNLGILLLSLFRSSCRDLGIVLSICFFDIVLRHATRLRCPPIPNRDPSSVRILSNWNFARLLVTRQDLFKFLHYNYNSLVCYRMNWLENHV
jgi:hypothetical protein